MNHIIIVILTGTYSLCGNKKPSVSDGLQIKVPVFWFCISCQHYHVLHSNQM